MRNAVLEEAQAGIKIAGRNINNLRYADDTTLMAESEQELKSLLTLPALLGGGTAARPDSCTSVHEDSPPSRRAHPHGCDEGGQGSLPHRG